MDSNDLSALTGELSLCEDIDGLKSVCEKFCSASSFEFYLLGVCDATSLNSPKVTTHTNYPESWFGSYFSDDMVKHDPVVLYCFENTTPIRWDKLIHMEKYISPVGEQLMLKAREFGLANGISIPIKAPSGEIAIFSVSTNCEENIDERFTHVLPLAQSFAYALFEHHTRLVCEASSGVSRASLSPREKECLFWACEGKTTWEMSKILNITERTVIFHLTSATKKLDANNRQHAVAKAIMYGLIKPSL